MYTLLINSDYFRNAIAFVILDIVFKTFRAFVCDPIGEVANLKRSDLSTKKLRIYKKSVFTDFTFILLSMRKRTIGAEDGFTNTIRSSIKK